MFRADFTISADADGVLFTQKIEDPRAFGVVVTDEGGNITDYIEKPQEFVSDQAMIGIYSFKDGARLKKELKLLIDNNVLLAGEYQLPEALRNMTKSGLKFIPGEVSEWMDCGNKKVTIETNRRVLNILEEEGRLHEGDGIDPSANIIDSTIVPPCYIGPGVTIVRSVVGPHVSLGANTAVTNSTLQDCLIQGNSTIDSSVMDGAMIGAKASVVGTPLDVSIGDFSFIG